MNRYLRILCLLTAAILLMTGAAFSGGICGNLEGGESQNPAQAPATASQQYLVITGQSTEESIKDLQTGNKTKNLISGSGVGCRVFMQHEKDVSTNQAEVHDGADDIFIIMAGTATFILGGKLDSPNQVQPGEWRAASITGGKEFKLGKGDMLIVPRGTPHVRTTAGQEVTIMVVKASTPAAK